MNIFSRIAARTLKVNYVRTLVSLFGIMLSSLLLTAIFGSVETLGNLLVTSTIDASGSWQIAYTNATKNDIQDALSDKRITASAEVERYGFALADSSEENDGYFTYFSLSSLPKENQDERILPNITLAEGRLPQTSSEIIIPEPLRGYTYDEGFKHDGFEQSSSFVVGSTVGMALGTRRAKSEGQYIDLDENYSVQIDERGDVTEELVNVAPMRTYTIVGMYSMEGTHNELWDNPAGYSFITYDDNGIEPVHSTLYVRADSLSSYQEIEGLSHRFDRGNGAVSATLHNNLLTYQGLTEDTPASAAFWAIGCLLSGIVLAASVTLVYNSFAISIAERTKQFGLLSSIGASKSQLRVSIFTEAAILGLAGIPAGILLGIASMRAAFALSQDGLLALLYGNGAIESANATIHVVVSAPVLIGIIAVEAATLLASTAVPAIRASKATAIDALRQPRDPQGTLANHRLYAVITRPLRRRGILRDFSRKIDEVYIAFGGIPHLLARRNLNRPNSKGRIAVVSLAISVALLVLSGALIQYLEQTVDIVGTQGVDITAYLDREIQEGESVTDLLADARTVGDKLESASDAELVGSSSFISSFGSLSNGVYNARALDSIQSETDALSDDPLTIIDDSYYGIIHLEFVDDESWSSYIESLGLNKDEYCDPANPIAVGFNGAFHQWDGKRYMVRSFSNTGTATLYTCIRAIDQSWPYAIRVGQDGQPEMEYNFNDDSATSIRLPMEAAVQGTYELPIGSIADTAPACAADTSVFSPMLILPVSALGTISEAATPTVDDARAQEMASGVSLTSRWSENNPFSFYPSEGSGGAHMFPLSTTYSFTSANPRKATEKLSRELNTLLNNLAVYPYGSANDSTESTRTQHAIILSVKIFTGCFAGITTLIAIANVFNTISTSFVLRRREFAILKSIGIDNKMFRRMIVRECASYAIRGLALGLSLAFAAIAALLNITGGVLVDAALALPPAWIALAAIVVLIVLGLSTAYALRKSNSGSVVESLREDLA